MIIEETCREFKVTTEELLGNKRNARIVTARQVVFYLTRKHTDMTLKEVGTQLNRHHSTVIHGVESVKSRRVIYSKFNRVLERIETRVTTEVERW